MKYVFALLLVSSWLESFAQTPVSRFSPPVTEVIVYFTGAELQHFGELNLTAGLSEVRIGNISAYLEPKSLQVEVTNAELLATNLVKVEGVNNLASDSLTLLQKELRMVNAELA